MNADLFLYGWIMALRSGQSTFSILGNSQKLPTHFVLNAFLQNKNKN